MQIIGYARTSTEEQSNGIEAQRAQLQAEAERRGWRLDIRHEHASGKTLARRKALREVLDDLDRAGPDGVLMVTKLDRLARSTIDCLDVLERARRKGWAIIVMNLGGEKLDTTTAAGKLQATMLAAFAEFEREMISDRTREGLAIVKARGVKLGRPSPVPDETRQRIVRLRATGLSWQAMADRLNADAVPGPAGGGWHPTSVRRVHGYALRARRANPARV
jgi:DNA invertase Pin-like site-specific DNA recombinase